MATFGTRVHNQQLLSTDGASNQPLVIYLLDNSAITIAVSALTNVQDGVKKIIKRLSLSKTYQHLFGLFMSIDGSIVSQRGLAHDLLVDMADQCAKIVFAPKLMVKRLLDDTTNPIVVKLLFTQLVHDFIIDKYRTINRDQGTKLAALILYAKYSFIEVKKRTSRFLESRMFEFLPLRLLQSKKKIKKKKNKNNTTNNNSTLIDEIWHHYSETEIINRNAAAIEAMHNAISFARSIPFVEDLWLCSNCITQCRQSVLTRLKSRCLIGCAVDGIRLFSASSSDHGSVKKWYPMKSIKKWGWSQSTGQLYIEVIVDAKKKKEEEDVVYVGDDFEKAEIQKQSGNNNNNDNDPSDGLVVEGKYFETPRAADLCDTLSEYARYRVKQMESDNDTNVLELETSKEAEEGVGMYKKRTSFIMKKKNSSKFRRQSLAFRRMSLDEMSKKKNNDGEYGASWVIPCEAYDEYAHYVCILLQALYRGYQARNSFDYMIEKRIQGLWYDDSDEDEEVEEELEKGMEKSIR